MPKILHAIVLATGGWTYVLEVTEEQAYQIINATIGRTVRLNQQDETIKVVDSSTMQHFRTTNIGYQTEDLVKRNVINKLQELINESAWDSDDSDEF